MANTYVFENKKVSTSTTAKEKSLSGKTQRRLHIQLDNLEEVPDFFFTVKVSQSKRPDKAGTTVFKYLTYRLKGSEDPAMDKTPAGVTPATPVSEIKTLFLQTIQAGAAQRGVELEVRLNVNLPGDFLNITTGDGEQYTVFDNKNFPASDGNPGYYLKYDTPATVELTEATSAFGPYLRVAMKTDLLPEEIFQKSGRAKVWGSEGGFDGLAESAVAAAGQTSDPLAGATGSFDDFFGA